MLQNFNLVAVYKGHMAEAGENVDEYYAWKSKKFTLDAPDYIVSWSFTFDELMEMEARGSGRNKEEEKEQDRRKKERKEKGGRMRMRDEREKKQEKGRGAGNKDG